MFITVKIAVTPEHSLQPRGNPPTLPRMGDADRTETGWRGSREGWLDAAYAALVSEGVDAVKIMPLAEGLKLSRTSFYWFFKDRAELLAALADMWEARTTAPLVAATRDYAETETEAMLNVIACFLRPETFDARLEFAMRGWGLKDARILSRINDADARRLAALSTMLERWGHDPQDADVRARTIYLVQIGYIATQAEETLQTRLTRIPNYIEIYTGRPPEPREIARFRGRFGL